MAGGHDTGGAVVMQSNSTDGVASPQWWQDGMKVAVTKAVGTVSGKLMWGPNVARGKMKIIK